jgi:hypothetical protein
MMSRDSRASVLYVFDMKDSLRNKTSNEDIVSKISYHLINEKE